MRLNPAQRKFVVAALIVAALISHVSVVRWRPFATEANPHYAVVAIPLRQSKWETPPDYDPRKASIILLNGRPVWRCPDWEHPADRSYGHGPLQLGHAQAAGTDERLVAELRDLRMRKLPPHPAQPTSREIRDRFFALEAIYDRSLRDVLLREHALLEAKHDSELAQELIEAQITPTMSAVDIDETAHLLRAIAERRVTEAADLAVRVPFLARQMRDASFAAHASFEYTPAAHAGVWIAEGVSAEDAWTWGIFVPLGLLGLLTFLWLGWRTPAAVQPTTAEPPAG